MAAHIVNPAHQGNSPTLAEVFDELLGRYPQVTVEGAVFAALTVPRDARGFLITDGSPAP